MSADSKVFISDRYDIRVFHLFEHTSGRGQRYQHEGKCRNNTVARPIIWGLDDSLIIPMVQCAQ